MRRDVSISRRCNAMRLGVGFCLIVAAAMGGCNGVAPSTRTDGAAGPDPVGPARLGSARLGSARLGSVARGSEAVFAGEQVREWVSDAQTLTLAEATRRDDALGYEPNGPLFDDGWITRDIPSIERPRYVFLGTSVRSNLFLFFRPENRR